MPPHITRNPISETFAGNLRILLTNPWPLESLPPKYHCHMSPNLINICTQSQNFINSKNCDQSPYTPPTGPELLLSRVTQFQNRLHLIFRIFLSRKNWTKSLYALLRAWIIIIISHHIQIICVSVSIGRFDDFPRYRLNWCHGLLGNSASIPHRSGLNETAWII